MPETAIRRAVVSFDRALEDQAREQSGLDYLTVGALVRVALANLARINRDEALRKYFFDPTGKRYKELMRKINEDAKERP